jgi:hypothetical protein
LEWKEGRNEEQKSKYIIEKKKESEKGKIKCQMQCWRKSRRKLSEQNEVKEKKDQSCQY